jgi:hypothetical protein
MRPNENDTSQFQHEAQTISRNGFLISSTSPTGGINYVLGRP